MDPQAQNVVQALAALPTAAQRPAPNSAYAIGHALGIPNLTPELLQQLLRAPMYAQPVTAGGPQAAEGIQRIVTEPVTGQ